MKKNLEKIIKRHNDKHDTMNDGAALDVIFDIWDGDDFDDLDKANMTREFLEKIKG